MTQAMFQFTCPRCDSSVVALVPEAAIAVDGDLHIPCIRGRRPAGCGGRVILKPSQGYRV